MERNSLIYKARRKGQALAYHLFSQEVMSKIYYRIVLKKKLNLSTPKTFNEKIQWCKLYYYPSNSLILRCTDKFKVRDYIREKNLERYLTPLIGSWDVPQQINWEELPNQFVLKCNHGCAYNLICEDKGQFDKKKAMKQLNTWLKEDFGVFNVEPHYSLINPKKILCEEYLGKELVDYKFFCFHGKPEFIYVSQDLIHDRQARIGFFDMKGNKLSLKRDDYADIPSITLPSYFAEMVNVAKILADDFPFVRVDFFLSNDRFYFAELTFTPGAGMMPFNPAEYDDEWGKLLKLPI